MFLVNDKRFGTNYLVFTAQDPRTDGFVGQVDEGVHLDYNFEAVHRWPDGAARPEASVGRSPTDTNHYKVFKYESDLREAGYEPVPGKALVFGSWADYQRFLPSADLDRDQWYEYLDEVDKVSRLRQDRDSGVGLKSKNRDDIAFWIAKTHMRADTGIREVWYLPDGSAPNEFRLLEVNDRIAPSEGKPEPIDFGLDVDGQRVKVLVADVTGPQVERIKVDPSLLPSGWMIDGSKIWRRRG